MNGYKNKLTFLIDRTPGKRLRETLAQDEYLIFRVRTKIDNDGNIISANYGKIYGPIQFGGGRPTDRPITFTYYFNPDGTPNLEYDPKKDLLKLGGYELGPTDP